MSNVQRASAERWVEDRPIPPRPPRGPADPGFAGLSKDDADCCQLVASRDPLGRPPIGFCGPDCQRRPVPLP